MSAVDTIRPREHGNLYGEVWDWLSRLEQDAILSGGSARVLARPADGDDDWCPAWVDDSGLWIDDPCDPGYVAHLSRWEITRYY